MQIKIKKLDSRAKVPTFAHEGDAGMDLYCIDSVTIKPGELVKIGTGISVELPLGYVALVWDKSGIAVNRQLKVFGGVLDAGYRGEYFVNLFNAGSEAQIFEAGDKVGQVLIQKIEHPKIIEVDEFSDTARGDGGFGSTGKN